MTCYTTTQANRSYLEALNAQISANMNLVNTAGTQVWGEVKDAINIDLSFLAKPSDDGFQNPGCEPLTQAQMLAGIDLTNVTEMEFDSSWIPSTMAM